MASLRGLLRRKSKSQLSENADQKNNNPYGHSEKNTPNQDQDKIGAPPPIPVVQIMRSTTYSQELLTAPSFSPTPTVPMEPTSKRNVNSGSSSPVPRRASTVKETGKRLSNLLHLNRRSRASSVTGTYVRPRSKGKDVPPPLPIRAGGSMNATAGRSEEERQAQWEQRATLLVEGTTDPVELPPSPGLVTEHGRMSFTTTRDQQESGNWPLRSSGSLRNKSLDGNTDDKSVEEKSDDDIQAAIHLHESGNLETSTAMFGRLADPSGANNALAQVLYGLALRHGWGIAPDPNLAIQYLTYSARNASNLTSSFPTSTSSPNKPLLKRGELTLAIYELGNCHRNGWGVAKSPALAMQYFETAAELGDVDAMIEIAMAWEKGVKGWQGGKKDRGMAARWYRRAERAGRKEVGNSWIWKEKYDGFDEGEKKGESVAADVAGGGGGGGGGGR
ncbi:MAG: hypothetical protein GOMPHAMPRED_002274 [Gomphillus americanus]|uniref:Uncharacterized protein n=1 Tax=Gomphillus americanus TaxID=1940652 RepID=A0A8H3F9N0_9LECA|nr:MAG: hypothetical protein GOMPHAMPRED_002274 [Gomphillus americanus]